MEPLSVRLRRLRARRLWSIAELAKRAGVSEGAILRIEHGQGRPTWRTLQRLAAALEVEPAELAPDVDIERRRGEAGDAGPSGGSQP